MIDIDKLRYDLAMNCALAFVLEQKKDADFNYRWAMTEAFNGYYHDFCTFDNERLSEVMDDIKDSEKAIK